MSEETLANRPIADLLVSGLLIDGSHHKQWYLERVLLALLGKEEFKKLRETIRVDGYEWENGIAP